MSVIALAERNVPRYTSYPTAPHFTGEVGGLTYTAWLAAIHADATLSLYLHVPYCTEICRYCGCHTKATRRSEPLDAYSDALIDEIDLVAARIASHRVLHLHWGGGTPSILGPERLARIVGEIAARFDLSSLVEHAIELDPRQVTLPLAQALAKFGITRASLGVQEFAPHVQEAIGRIQQTHGFSGFAAYVWSKAIDDASDGIDFVPGADLPKRFAELEKRLLVHVESFHSEAGSHHKLFRSWARYWRNVGYAPPRLALPRAIAELQGAVDELARASHVRVRVPW